MNERQIIESFNVERDHKTSFARRKRRLFDPLEDRAKLRTGSSESDKG